MKIANININYTNPDFGNEVERNFKELQFARNHIENFIEQFFAEEWWFLEKIAVRVEMQDATVYSMNGTEFWEKYNEDNQR